MRTSLPAKSANRQINAAIPPQEKKKKAGQAEKKHMHGALKEAVEKALEGLSLAAGGRALAPEIAKRYKAEEYSAIKILKIAQRHKKPKHVEHTSSASASSRKVAKTRRVLSPILQRIRAAEELGQQVRDRVVLPSQLMPALQAYFPQDETPPKKIKCLAQVICREVNRMTANFEKFKGKSLSLERKAHMYVFPNKAKLSIPAALRPLPKGVDSKSSSLAKEKKSYASVLRGAVNLPIKTPSPSTPKIQFLEYACWLEMSTNGKKIRVLLIELDDESKLGQGTYKKIYRAHNLEMELEVQAGKTAIAARKVLIRPAVFMQAIAEDEDSLRNIRNGFSMQHELLNKIKLDSKAIEAKINLAGLPIARLGTNPNDLGLERRQEWYNGDLDKAIKEKKLPLSIHKDSALMDITLDQCLQALMDTAVTLRKMHALGIVHRDVKTRNTLLKIDDAKVSSYLCDFDMAEHICLSMKYNYEYWDKASREGLVTPFTDCFGLAISVAEVILGGFSEVSSIIKDLNAAKDLDQQRRWENGIYVRRVEKAIWAANDMIPHIPTRTELLDLPLNWNNPTDPKTIAEICQKIQEFLDHPAMHIPAPARKVLQGINADLQLASMACQLVFKTLARCQKVFEYFCNLHQKEAATFDILFQRMPEKNPRAEKAVMAKKLDIIAKCSKALGGYSIESIQQEIEAIQKVLES